MKNNITQQKKKNKAACQPLSEAQYKSYTILTRLQVRLLEFCEEVPASLHYAVARKKKLCFLSEVVPDGTVK